MDKCNFGRTEIKFLSFYINTTGWKCDAVKLKSIDSFAQPTSVKEVQRFLGLTGFLRRFVQNYATITRPLSLLTRTGKMTDGKFPDFQWNDEAEKAFLNYRRTLNYNVQT
uniref:Reverse transcriptase/retrotransposon-derived protein RNase H-like domain-containing protein n=1 Tax=Strigamia maritima TaxID=126957 RepID=T1IMX6_STRMM